MTNIPFTTPIVWICQEEKAEQASRAPYTEMISYEIVGDSGEKRKFLTTEITDYHRFLI